MYSSWITQTDFAHGVTEVASLTHISPLMKYKDQQKQRGGL